MLAETLSGSFMYFDGVANKGIVSMFSGQRDFVATDAVGAN